MVARPRRYLKMTQWLRRWTGWLDTTTGLLLLWLRRSVASIRLTWYDDWRITNWKLYKIDSRKLIEAVPRNLPVRTEENQKTLSQNIRYSGWDTNWVPSYTKLNSYLYTSLISRVYRKSKEKRQSRSLPQFMDRQTLSNEIIQQITTLLVVKYSGWFLFTIEIFKSAHTQLGCVTAHLIHILETCFGFLRKISALWAQSRFFCQYWPCQIKTFRSLHHNV